MTSFIRKLGRKAYVRIGGLATVGIGLSGCTSDVGLGNTSDGYGGGWYDDYLYPGHGFFPFNNCGRRYAMRDNYRRNWSERRHH